MNGCNLGTWPDIDVTRWTIKEYIQDRIQSDGYVWNHHMRKCEMRAAVTIIDYYSTIPYVFLLLMCPIFLTNRSSCGLFMLQFIEYWTGHKLSHPVTQVIREGWQKCIANLIQCCNILILIIFLQEDVKPFRQKVAIILHESDLNDIKGTPEYHNPADDIIDTDGVEILDPPPAMVVLRMPLNKNELLCKLRGHIMSIHNADSRE